MTNFTIKSPEGRAILQHAQEVFFGEGIAVTVGNTALEIPAGDVDGQSSVNKFGRSTNVDDGVDVDIWDRANATQDQDIWVAPTQARIHTIQSGAAGDAVGGAGIATVDVSYLADWDTDEQVERVSGNLATGEAMANAAVIIHRIKSIPQATTTLANVGLITATAAVDGSVTAQINIAEGQTQMAVYGIPSTKTAYMVSYYSSAIKAASSLGVELKLLVNPSPDVSLTSFLVKHTISLATEGTSYARHVFDPYFKITGPAIIKIQANSSANDTDVSGGFDLILVDN